MPGEVRAAVRESADLGQWLGNKVHNLFSTPMEIIAFSDEEGVRYVLGEGCFMYIYTPTCASWPASTTDFNTNLRCC